MRKKKPSTGTNNNTYQKQQSKLLKSIKDIVKRGLTRGFLFFNNPVPENLQIDAEMTELVIPKSVKNPTEVTVRKLQRIKETLYDNAIWIDPEYSPDNPEYQKGTENYSHPSHATGIFSGTEGRAIERSRSSRKGWAKRRNQLDDTEWTPPHNPEPPSHEPVWYPVFDTIEEYLSRLESIRGAGTEATQAERETHGHRLLWYFHKQLEIVMVDEVEHLYAKWLDSNAAIISSCVDDMLADSRGDRFDTNVNQMLVIINWDKPLSPEDSETLEDYMHGIIDLPD